MIELLWDVRLGSIPLYCPCVWGNWGDWSVSVTLSGWVCLPVATGCTIITRVCIVLMFCGRALVTERWAWEGGREEVCRWGLSTLLSSLGIFHWHFCYLATLLPYYLTTLQPYNFTTLPPYHLTTLQPYNLTTLPPYYLTARPPREKVSVKEKVNEFCPSPRSSRWQCVALSCLHHRVIIYDCGILYYYMIY